MSYRSPGSGFWGRARDSQGGGPFAQGSNGGTLDERRKALLEYLMSRGQGQAGFNGLQAMHGRSQSAVGNMGGIGGAAPSSGMSYNPFLAQIAGRQENFNQLPQGITRGAADAVQGNMGGPQAGLVQAPAGGVAPGGYQQPAGGAMGRGLLSAPPPPIAIGGAPQVQPNALAPGGGGVLAGGAGGIMPFDPFMPQPYRPRGGATARY